MIHPAYIQLRQTLGVLGIALPLLVILFGLLGHNGPEWWYSISATYYTNAGPLFIAIMGAVGLFLMTYHGYYSISPNWFVRYCDRIVNTASGIFCLLVAFFPCGASELERVGILFIPVKTSAIIHDVSACILFLLLAFNILFLFTKSASNPTREKICRNRIYRICGVGILVFIASQVIFSLSSVSGPYTMINEAGMLLCFGVAWLVKGETIFKDKPALPVNRS